MHRNLLLLLFIILPSISAKAQESKDAASNWQLAGWLIESSNGYNLTSDEPFFSLGFGIHRLVHEDRILIKDRPRNYHSFFLEGSWTRLDKNPDPSILFSETGPTTAGPDEFFNCGIDSLCIYSVTNTPSSVVSLTQQIDSVIPLLLNYRYDHHMNHMWGWYAGAGVGLAFVDLEGSYNTINSNRKNYSHLSFFGVVDSFSRTEVTGSAQEKQNELSVVYAAQVFAGLYYEPSENWMISLGARYQHYGDYDVSYNFGDKQVDASGSLDDSLILELGARYSFMGRKQRSLSTVDNHRWSYKDLIFSASGGYNFTSDAPYSSVSIGTYWFKDLEPALKPRDSITGHRGYHQKSNLPNNHHSLSIEAGLTNGEDPNTKLLSKSQSSNTVIPDACLVIAPPGFTAPPCLSVTTEIESQRSLLQTFDSLRPLSINYTYKRHFTNNLGWFAGGGLGVAFVKLKGEYSSSTTTTVTRNDILNGDAFFDQTVNTEKQSEFSDDKDTVFLAQGFAGIFYEPTNNLSINLGARYQHYTDYDITYAFSGGDIDLKNAINDAWIGDISITYSF